MIREINLSPGISSPFFLDSLTKVIDHFAAKYVSHLIMGIFNMESSNAMFKCFLDSINLPDLILRAKNSQLTSPLQTGSIHHHMKWNWVIIVIWSTQCLSHVMYNEPKSLNYRERKGPLSGLRLFLTTGNF